MSRRGLDFSRQVAAFLCLLAHQAAANDEDCDEGESSTGLLGCVDGDQIEKNFKTAGIVILVILVILFVAAVAGVVGCILCCCCAFTKAAPAQRAPVTATSQPTAVAIPVA